jgi:hypothetical protein
MQYREILTTAEIVTGTMAVIGLSEHHSNSGRLQAHSFYLYSYHSNNQGIGVAVTRICFLETAAVPASP